MRSLTSLPVFISETDLAPLSTTGQECNGGGYQSITSFVADLFSNGGDGILQFQDGTTALSSAQWAELDAALAKAPHPASSPASSQAPSQTLTSMSIGDERIPATVTPLPGGCTAEDQTFDPVLLRAW